jgi:low temperature requirement protein LtrA
MTTRGMVQAARTGDFEAFTSSPTEAPGSRLPGMVRLHTPMSSRDPDEPHRVSTPLELFFDLTFVVAVAQASSTLHHLLVDGHARDALVAFPMVFFAIWWAWMNFTWFSSAYDPDDAAFRVATFVQMAGVLVFAAGVPRFLEDLASADS